MSSQTQWALVADAQNARIFESRGIGAPWVERFEEAIHESNLASRDLGSERPGRTHESMGATRHAIEPRQDPHRAAKASFARRLAERLELAATRSGYAHLLLVAPPAFLGDLRLALGDVTRRLLRGTLNKDLTHLPMAELVPHLAGIDQV
jgi:protein required for attachment to host cells